VTAARASAHAAVLRLADIDSDALAELLLRFGLSLHSVALAHEIPGSYWGEDEAGLIGAKLYARPDTPLHSILHEASHWITCSPERRASLHTDAADNQLEENASCFLQIILSDYVPGFGRTRALEDMDAWGYSFRLGHAAAWFNDDAIEEKAWLIRHHIVCAQLRPSFRVRG
jgi:hypothetical protein